MTSRAIPPWLLALACLAPLGCGWPAEIDTTYGRSRGASINGTSAFADLIRQRGGEVRTALRLNETVAGWADVLVRFAPYSGPPDRDEARWMTGWLNEGRGRKVVYVARDYDAAPEFWNRMVANLPPGTPAETADRVRNKRDSAATWVGDLPPKSKTPARAEDWFAVDPKPPAPAPCKALEGPWAEGVDAVTAAVPRHEAFKVDQEDVLLSGDGGPLAMTWTLDQHGSAVLAVANGSFLLNAALLNRARRPLAIRAVDWIGPGPGQGPRKVAFVDGSNVLAAGDEDSPSGSPLHLLQVPPFGWIAAHLAGFGLLLCLSLAATLGRARPAPSGEVGRPSAHPEALGALLARTGRADFARDLLETYRRWRHPAQAAGRAATSPAPPPPTRAPLA